LAIAFVVSDATVVWSSHVAGPRLVRSEDTQLEEQAAAPAPRPQTHSTSSGSKQATPRFVVPPFVSVVTAMSVGIVLDRYLEPWETRKWVGLTLVFTAIAVFLVRRSAICAALVLAAIAALSGAWHHYRYSDMDPGDLALRLTETPHPAWVRGLVRDALGIRTSEGFGFGASGATRVSTRFVVDLTEISDGKGWHRASGRATTIVTGDRSEILAGQPVEAAGQIALIAPPLNPGEFDYRAFQRVEGIRLRFTVGDPQSFWRRQGGADFSLRRLLGQIRSWSRARLVERLDPSVAPLASALLLGQREGIEPEVNDAFARTGTTHLLAISGLQLQALAFALLLAFRVAGLPRRPAYLGVALAMVSYAFVVGPAPSVVRATVMTATFCLAAISRRLNRPANTLALAALGTLAVNPSYLFDVGCQLSFLAIGALIWLVPPASASVRNIIGALRSRFLGPFAPLDELERGFEPHWRAVLRGAAFFVIDGLVASTVVWLAALPLVAMRFHLVSPIGVLLNIPLIPLTTAAMLLGGLGLVCSTIWGPLGGPLAWGAAWLLRLTRAIVLWGVDERWGHRFVVGPAWGWVLVFYVLLVLAVLVRTQNLRLGRLPSPRLLRAAPWWLLAAWALPGWLFSAALTSRSPIPEVEFLSVGHGLAVLIRAENGRAVLYDCGRLGDPSVGRRIVAPALWERGVGRIDAVFLSHADQDHYDGLVDLLDRFPIGVVRITPHFGGDANPAAIDLLRRIESRGIPIQPVTAPESWQTAGVSFVVRHPPTGWDPEASDNARSIVLDVAYAGRHILLTGDLELSGLDELVAQPRPESPPEVMLAPHHGGRVANPEWLYQWARPRMIVASQRPPSSAANDPLAAIERLGFPVLRTWRRGAVRISWSDDGVVATGFLDKNGKQPEIARGRATPAEIRLEHPAASRESNLPKLSSFALGPKLLVGLAGFLLGAFACLVLAVVEIGAWALVMPYRSVAPGSHAASAGADLAAGVETIVARATDGSRLVARWFPAHGPSSTGRTVLLLHGFAETSRALEAARAAALNRYGWNVAALDSRGHGQSEGDYSTFGGLEARDIQVWLDELAARVAWSEPPLPFQPVLWGRSMGAAIALRAAALDPRAVALVLEAPMVDLVASTATVLRRRRLPFARILARLVVRRAGKLAGMRIDRPGPLETAPSVRCPAAIIHGTDDSIVPLDQARRLADAFPLAPHWFDVPGAKHVDVIDKGGEPLLAQIAGVLEKAAGDRSAG
jgi:competence protein ComEC